MPAFIVRRKFLVKNQMQISANGNVIDNLAFGTTTGSKPSATTLTMVTGSFAAPGVAVGDMIFVTAGSLQPDIYIQSASVSAASVITASFYNSGSATQGLAAVTLNYLAISPS